MFVLFRQQQVQQTCPTPFHTPLKVCEKISPQHKHLCFLKHHRLSLSIPCKLAGLKIQGVGHALTCKHEISFSIARVHGNQRVEFM